MTAGIRESWTRYLLARLLRWLRDQGRSSLIVAWLTGQPEGNPTRLWTCLRERWVRLGEKLRMDRLLAGSIFLHPALFAGAAVALAPLLPTMGVLALCAGALGAFALRMGAEGPGAVVHTPLHRYVVLLAGIYLLSALTSVTPGASLMPGLLTAVFMLLYTVLPGCLSRQGIRRLLNLMALAGAAVALWGFYQALHPDQFRSVWTDTDMFSTLNFRVYSTLENPNVLGEYFLLALPLSAALTLGAETWRERLLGGGSCLMMAVCLVLTYSRGCYLGLLLAAAVFLVLLDARLLILGVAALLLSPLVLPEAVLQRLSSIGDLADTSTAYRFYIWRGTLSMLKDFWLCGLGPGSDAFSRVYNAYGYDFLAPHAHNLFLQLICDGGIMGLVTFLILCLGAFRMLCTALRREQDRLLRLVEIGCVAALCGFLAESMTDYTFYNYRVLLLFFGVLGIGGAAARGGKRP